MNVVAPEQLPPFTVAALGESAFRLGFCYSTPQRAALSPDGARIYFASYPHVLVVSTEDGLVRDRLSAKNAIHHQLAFACDGALIVRTSDELWWSDDSLATITAIRVQTSHSTLLSPSPTAPRRCVVVNTYGPTAAQIVDADPGAAAPIVALELEPSNAAPCSVAHTRDGEEVLLALRDRILRFDARTGAARGALLETRQTSPFDSVARFVVADQQRGVVLWTSGAVSVIDLASGAVINTSTVGGCWHLSAVSAKGRFVIATTGVAYVLDLSDLRVVAVVRADIDPRYEGEILVSPGDEHGWIADYRGALHRISLEDGALDRREPASFPCDLAWRGDELLVARLLSPVEAVDLRTGDSRMCSLGEFSDSVRLSPEGDRALGFAGNSGRGRWRTLSDGSATEPVQTSRPNFIAGDTLWWFDEKQRCLSTEGRSFAIAPIKNVQLAVGSSSGRRALLTTRSEAVIVDLEAGVELARYKMLSVSAAKFVTDGELVTVGSKGVHWLDATTGAVLARSGKAWGDCIAVTQSGAVVATASGIHNVTLVSRDRPDDLVSFVGASHPKCVAFSSDGSRLAVAGNESVVRVFDVDAALATRPAPKAKKPARAKAR